MEQTVLPPPEKKAGYVRAMFGRIARRYDLMNRLMTLGRDRAWRRHTAGQLSSLTGIPNRMSILDVATGTGDLALELLRQYPGAAIVGLDLTPEMLALARAKAAHQKVSRAAAAGLPGQPAAPGPYFACGDALRLPFPDAAFDGIATGFALRNVTDIPAAFVEMARVIRPGGRLACLEIARPVAPLFGRLFHFYFYRLVPLIGGLVSGERAAYTYLPHSLTAFLTPGEVADVMRRAGWSDVRYRRLMLGTVAVHTATKM